MDAVFDRLAREISREERRAMLAKIGETQDLAEEPMRLDDAEDNQSTAIDHEYANLSFFAKLRIIILNFFTRKGRKALVEEHLLNKLKRRVERSSPGLIDFHRMLVSPKFYHEIVKLRSAMEVFRRPMLRALEGDKPDFYALLGKMEFDDIQERLETELKPEKFASQQPDALPVEIKRKMEGVFEGIFEDIVPDRRRRMLSHTTTLARLKALTRFPYNHILGIFPPGDKGPSGPASITALKAPLLQLGDALHAFRKPPTGTLLETLFLFDLQDSIADETDRLEIELTERMDKATAALDIIRKVNSEIPWSALLKALAGDIHYSPRPVSGGEDWFRVYKAFWKDRIDLIFRIWADRTRLSELLHGLTVLWGLDLITAVPGYRGSEFPENVQPRHEASFSAARAFFLEILPGKLYHALNLIMIDGKFYKKDNRREFEEVFGRMLKTPDKIRSFEARMRPEGEYGQRQTTLRRERSAGEDTLKDTRDLVTILDRESQNLVVPIIGDLKAMNRLLKGVLEGSGGPYDTLSNMSEIGGQGHETFRGALRAVNSIIEQSAILLSEMVTLEEKRILS